MRRSKTKMDKIKKKNLLWLERHTCGLSRTLTWMTRKTDQLHLSQESNHSSL